MGIYCIKYKITDTVSFEMHVYVCCSYQMHDWDGKLLAEANAKKHTLPSFFPITYHYPMPRDWDNVSKVCMSIVLILLLFYRASAVLGVVILSVRPSVRHTRAL